jgi:hypothetical protein
MRADVRIPKLAMRPRSVFPADVLPQIPCEWRFHLRRCCLDISHTLPGIPTLPRTLRRRLEEPSPGFALARTITMISRRYSRSASCHGLKKDGFSDRKSHLLTSKIHPRFTSAKYLRDADSPFSLTISAVSVWPCEAATLTCRLSSQGSLPPLHVQNPRHREA